MRRGRLPTFGVEEESLLLNPKPGHPSTRAPNILHQFPDRAFTAELATFQMEANTPACRSSDDADHG
ncbi:hypothetical protein [Saccharopolyspora sp. NPDC002376]